MKIRLLQFSTLIFLASPLGVVGAQESRPDRVPKQILYIGDAATPRAKAFREFLGEKFTKVVVADRDTFDPKQASEFDVVLLDWPQIQEGKTFEEIFPPKTSPLGKREEWKKPTVLLGSAGLMLSTVWGLKGGRGCTCLEPYAYGFRDHEIFRSPIPVDTKKTVPRKTPELWRRDVKEAEVQVVPITEIEPRIGMSMRGWCTIAALLANAPEVEIFCGGINTKLPTHAGLWREGNLLHFGFEPSPRELNEAGRAMLINSIHYISRFSEDQPLGISRSTSNSSVPLVMRATADVLLARERTLEQLKLVFTDTVSEELNKKSVSERQAWFETEYAFLYSTMNERLEIDQDVKALKIGFEAPEFLPRLIRDLDSNQESDRQHSMRLLTRYVDAGGAAITTKNEWQHWYKENAPYLYFSETCGYHWMVDTLAKRRKTPTLELRGAARADLRSAATDNSTPTVQLRVAPTTTDDQVSVDAEISNSTLKLTLKIRAGLHLYPPKSDEGIPISLRAASGSAFEPAGGITVDVNKSNHVEGTCILKTPLKRVAPGDILKLEFTYQACDEEKCLPPKTIKIGN